MKKFTMLTAALMLFAFLTLPIGMRGQTRDVETFTFSELGYGNGDDVAIVEGDDVTLTFDQGTLYYWHRRSHVHRQHTRGCFERSNG